MRNSRIGSSLPSVIYLMCLFGSYHCSDEKALMQGRLPLGSNKDARTPKTEDAVVDTQTTDDTTKPVEKKKVEPKPGEPAPVEEVTTETPEETPIPPEPAPAVDWDPRLDDLKISLVEADVTPGTLYWRLVRADYEDPTEHNIDFGGDHHAYYVLKDENGKPVPNQEFWQSWPDGKVSSKTKGDGVGDIPIWANYYPDRGPGPYNAWVGGDLPSDEVRGMGLPAKHHSSFIMYFQKTIKKAE